MSHRLCLDVECLHKAIAKSARNWLCKIEICYQWRIKNFPGCANPWVWGKSLLLPTKKEGNVPRSARLSTVGGVGRPPSDRDPPLDRDPPVLWTKTPSTYIEWQPLQWSVCILLECILIWQDFCQKLHENERNWTQRGMARVPSPLPPTHWIGQWLRVFQVPAVRREEKNYLDEREWALRISRRGWGRRGERDRRRYLRKTLNENVDFSDNPAISRGLQFGTSQVQNYRDTGRAQLVRSHSSARNSFKLSGNLN